jgi:hypothetical protein
LELDFLDLYPVSGWAESRLFVCPAGISSGPGPQRKARCGVKHHFQKIRFVSLTCARVERQCVVFSKQSVHRTEISSEFILKRRRLTVVVVGLNGV